MIVSIVAVALFVISDDESVITVLDSKDSQIVSDNISNYIDNENAAYLDVVLTEAVEALAAKYSITAEDAKKKLLKSDYTIYTNFDPTISNTLKNACEYYSYEVNIGGAITNLNGDLLAVVSACGERKNTVNYALQKGQPCSSFKPLAVYAPAIENQTVHWSTLFEDTPYTTIKTADGKTKEWPANSTGTYSYEKETVAKAIAKSLNTISVKCLSKYGVNKSIDFLEKNFGINLDYEKKQSSKISEDEIIGNIALGSTYKGFSAVDMAGYYQIFANGGVYSSPKSIRKIVDSKGKTIYESEEEKRQVISSQTAQIMNELLQKVVTDPEGTGKKAYCKNVTVAGKTGTGDNDNWFVGVTPQYSCAIWHSNETKNTCSEIFAQVFKNVEHQKSEFSKTDEVTRKIYCLKSGKFAGQNCKTFDMGYYTYGTAVSYCDEHK